MGGFYGVASKGDCTDDLFYGTEVRTRHTKNYMRTFERLCGLARNCDVDSIIEDSLKQNAFGLLYTRMREAGPGEPETG